MRRINKLDLKVFEFSLVLPNEIVASDPCYDFGKWCQQILSIKGGEYIAKVERFDDGTGWGTRNYILKLNHISCPKKKATSYECTLGVDSGQMGIFNADYYEQNQPSKEWYRMVCDTTLYGNRCGVTDEKGIVTESGCGDGGYELKVGYNSKKEIVALEISFV